MDKFCSGNEVHLEINDLSEKAYNMSKNIEKLDDIEKELKEKVRYLLIK